MNTQPIKTKYEEAVRKSTTKAAVKVAKEICRLFPRVQQIQPTIKGINTGMGSWSFNGHAVAIATEEGCEGEIIIIDDVNIEDAIKSGSTDWYNFEVSKEMKSICEMLNLLIDVNELNCSTWQDGFNEKGIIFLHSETSNQSNPFATPNKEYWMDNDYYRGLVKAKVPIIFEEE